MIHPYIRDYVTLDECNDVPVSATATYWEGDGWASIACTMHVFGRSGGDREQIKSRSKILQYTAEYPVHSRHERKLVNCYTTGFDAAVD